MLEIPGKEMASNCKMPASWSHRVTWLLEPPSSSCWCLQKRKLKNWKWIAQPEYCNISATHWAITVLAPGGQSPTFFTWPSARIVHSPLPMCRNRWACPPPTLSCLQIHPRTVFSSSNSKLLFSNLSLLSPSEQMASPSSGCSRSSPSSDWQWCLVCLFPLAASCCPGRPFLPAFQPA